MLLLLLLPLRWCCTTGVSCRAFKSVVFVIDGLEAFMGSAKQTLLYNVMDALQHSQVQVGACRPAVSGSCCSCFI
jgi:hypothetical protein